MKKESNNYNTQPDLYSRNLIISEGVKKFKVDNQLKKVKILDVGGRGGKLNAFLDEQDELTILDIRSGKEKNLIVGDATEMTFPDDTFDIVTSGDVFEHISSAKRERFIVESLRVAKYLVILAAPFDEGKNVIEEKAINQYYFDLTGKNHEWLEEHIKNGLPKVKELERILKKEKIQTKTIFSNSISNWKLTQMFVMSAFALSLDSKYVNKYYEYYNKKIKGIEDPKEGSYRRICFIKKQGKLDFDFQYKFQPALKEKLFSIAFSSMAKGTKDIVKDRDDHIEDLRKEIARLTEVANVAGLKHLDAEKELKSIKDGKIV